MYVRYISFREQVLKPLNMSTSNRKLIDGLQFSSLFLHGHMMCSMNWYKLWPMLTALVSSVSSFCLPLLQQKCLLILKMYLFTCFFGSHEHHLVFNNCSEKNSWVWCQPAIAERCWALCILCGCLNYLKAKLRVIFQHSSWIVVSMSDYAMHGLRQSGLFCINISMPRKQRFWLLWLPPCVQAQLSCGMWVTAK